MCHISSAAARASRANPLLVETSSIPLVTRGPRSNGVYQFAVTTTAGTRAVCLCAVLGNDRHRIFVPWTLGEARKCRWRRIGTQRLQPESKETPSGESASPERVAVPKPW